MWNYNFHVYILSNFTNSAVYTGVTNDLKRRVFEHKEQKIDGFTKTYNVNKLVYFEHFTNINDAIRREKQLKKWKRSWKNELIEKDNPEWRDLYDEI